MGYFDLQVSGYAGVDFNRKDFTPEELHTACRRLRADGVDGVLATVTTERLDLMCARLRHFAELRQDDELAADVIAGLHVEGPFINEAAGYRGGHPADAVVPADVDAMQRLLDAGAGLVKLVTLAPEQDRGFRVIRMLTDRGVVVAAGHCNPSIDELRGAVDAGVTMFTHLGNGVPMQIQRHDNIIQRALSLTDRIWACFIADGVHIPMFALGNYLRAAGLERSIVVSDAIEAAGLGPGKYRAGRWELVVDENLAAWAPDRTHLLGSAITMQRADANLQSGLGLTQEEVKLLTSVNPRTAIGMAEV